MPPLLQSLKLRILQAGRLLGVALLTPYLLTAAFAWFLADTLIFPAPTADYPADASILKLTDRRGETIAATDRVFQYAVETLGYRPEAIRLYGRALGSGPATYLAERYPVAGLILDSAFTSTFRVPIGVKLLPFDRFDNHARRPRIPCPVLLLHGTEDRLIPLAHAARNALAIGPRARTHWVDGAGHNNLVEVVGPAYWAVTLDFIRNPPERRLISRSHTSTGTGNRLF